MRLFPLQAALGIANLIVMSMMESGVSQAEARNKIWMYDQHGLLVKVSVCSTDIEQNTDVCMASCLAPHCLYNV